MQKICKVHGLTDFSNSVTRSRCKKCSIEAVRKRRLKVKNLSIEYKGGCCQQCGYNKCIEALEFHHVDPSQKDFEVSGNGHCKSWETIKKELDKCILLCANCHRELHALLVQR